MGRRAIFDDDLYSPSDSYSPEPGQAPVPRAFPEVYQWASLAEFWVQEHFGDCAEVRLGLCAVVAALPRFVCDDHVLKENGEQFLLLTAEQLAEFLKEVVPGGRWSKKRAMRVLHALCLTCSEGDGDFYFKRSRKLVGLGVAPVLKVYEMGWVGRGTAYQLLKPDHFRKSASKKADEGADSIEGHVSVVPDGNAGNPLGEPIRDKGDAEAPLGDVKCYSGDIKGQMGDIGSCSAVSNKTICDHADIVKKQQDIGYESANLSVDNSMKNHQDDENLTSPSSLLNIDITTSKAGREEENEESRLQSYYDAFLQAYGHDAGNRDVDTRNKFNKLVEIGYSPESLVRCAADYRAADTDPSERIVYPLIFLGKPDLLAEHGCTPTSAPKLDPNWSLETAEIAWSRGGRGQELFITGPDGARRPTGVYFDLSSVGKGEDEASVARRVLFESSSRDELERIARKPVSKSV